jgi:hypothetical protein
VDSDVLSDVLPAYFDSTGCRLSPPVDVLVRLKIKTSGEGGEGGSVSVEGETSGQFACLARELRLWTFSPALRRGASRGVPGGGPRSLSFERSVTLRFCRIAIPSKERLVESYGGAPRAVGGQSGSPEHPLRLGLLHKDRPFARIVQGAMRSPKIGLYRPPRIWKSHAE